MNIEAIEELIRRYLSTGIAVVIILIAPGTGDTGSTGGALPTDPSVSIIEPDGSRSGEHTLPGTGDKSLPAPPERGDNADPVDDPPTDDNPDGRTGAGGSDPDRDTSPTGDTGDTGDSRRPATGGGTDQPADRPDGSGGSSSGGSGSGSCNCPGGSNGNQDSSNRSRAGNDSGSNDSGNADNGRDTTSPGSDTTSPGSDTSRDPSGGASPGDPATGDRTDTGSSDGDTAAERNGWGEPDRMDDFSGGAEQWSIYDGPGHAGKGTRSPSAVSLDNGILTITGDSSGTTAGMAWNPGQKYGRWEGRVKAPASDPSYNALLLLWPDAENFPVGGEIDFMEMMDPTRQETNIFLHHGADNSQLNGKVQVDATQWHNWALEWTPDSITAYVDGEEWYRTTDKATFPPGPMHLAIQLDWFPKGGTPDESAMYVDWVKQWSIDSTETGSDRDPGQDRDSGNASNSDGGNSDAGAGDQGTGGDERESTSPVRELVRRMFSWR